MYNNVIARGLGEERGGGVKYRLQRLIIQETKKCRKILSSGRGERKLAENLQNLRGFDFDFLF